jgi:hypothetical protein
MNLLENIDKNNLPKHLAIIMDEWTMGKTTRLLEL